MTKRRWRRNRRVGKDGRHMEKRIFSLDLVRAASIFLVFLSHILFFWPGVMTAFFAFLGMLGVELFFTLSGFLIGAILLDLEQRGLYRAGVGRFLMRRWLRTLPAYYVVLALIAATTPSPEWHSFVFAQHWLDGGGMLPVSWSLAMEEIFYLVFPVLLLLVRPLAARLGMSAVLLGALILIVLCPPLRAWMALAGIDAQDPTYHSHPLLRLDCCAYGVLAACARRYGLSRPLRVLACAGFALSTLFTLLLWMSAFETGETWAPLRQLWGRTLWSCFFALIAAPTALLLLALWSGDGGASAGGAQRLVSWISRTSYSLYLVHLPIIFWVADHVSASWAAWVRAGLATVLTLAATALLHYGVERPFLRLRDRHYPAPGPRPVAPVALAV